MGVYDIDWDLLLRKRFMNWDAEVAPNDKHTKTIKKLSRTQQQQKPIDTNKEKKRKEQAQDRRNG